MLKVITKTFNELNTKELYDLLQLRSEVFVVEQNCVYQDVDGKDMKALHILGYLEDKLIAYARLFKPGDYFNEASIGRVVVKEEERQFKHGYTVMEAAIEAIKKTYNQTTIKVSAQTYLTSFYNNLGFNAVGEEYLEDEIPHIAMVKT